MRRTDFFSFWSSVAGLAPVSARPLVEKGLGAAVPLETAAGVVEEAAAGEAAGVGAAALLATVEEEEEEEEEADEEEEEESLADAEPVAGDGAATAGASLAPLADAVTDEGAASGAAAGALGAGRALSRDNSCRNRSPAST